MSTTLSNINTLVNDRRRDTGSSSIDMTANGFRAVNSALEIWNSMHEFPWQLERTTVQYNVGIDTYTLPTNFKAFKQVKPKKGQKTNNPVMFTNNGFETQILTQYRFALQSKTQTQRLRLQYAGNMALLNGATTYNGNGTWVGATAISNVATDPYEFLELGGSTKFDYSGTSGTITNSTFNAVDVSRYAQRGAFYASVYLQSVTSLTSIVFKVGTDSSNYLSGTITTDYIGNALVVGWNRIKLTWDGSTSQTGTVTNTSFGYLQLTIAYSVNPVTVSNRIENFFVSENVPVDIDYYTSNMVQTSAGTKTQIFSNSANTTDVPLWSGEWDWVTEGFINSVLEMVFWMTGEYTDRQTAIDNIQKQVNLIKIKAPSGKLYPTLNQTVDLNNFNGNPTNNINRGNPFF